MAEEELERKRSEIEDEAADIFFALLNFCVRSNIDFKSQLRTENGSNGIEISNREGA